MVQVVDKTIVDKNKYTDESYKDSPAWQQYMALLTASGQSGTLGSNAGLTTSSSYSPGGSGGGGGGGRSGGGRSGGGGRVKKPLNLAVYKRGKYNNSGLRQDAKLQADARNREAYAASNTSRRSANTRYENAIREYALNQQRDTEANEGARQSALAGMNNTALNRGMGYGQGIQSTAANMNLGYNKQLNDLLATYAMNRANALSERDSIYANMDEQDRVTLANRQALISEIFRELDDSMWSRYLGTEGLRQDEIDSENARRQALYQSLY